MCFYCHVNESLFLTLSYSALTRSSALNLSLQVNQSKRREALAKDYSNETSVAVQLTISDLEATNQFGVIK
jgi:hypothetical protein